MAFEAPTCHLGAITAGPFAGIRQIHQAILREFGVQRDVEQPALADGGDRGHALDRPRVEPAVGGDDAQSPRALGHQQAAIGEEGEAPRVVEVFGEGDGAETLNFAVEHLGAGRRREHCRQHNAARCQQAAPTGWRRLRQVALSEGREHGDMHGANHMPFGANRYRPFRGVLELGRFRASSDRPISWQFRRRSKGWRDCRAKMLR